MERLSEVPGEFPVSDPKRLTVVDSDDDEMYELMEKIMSGRSLSRRPTSSQRSRTATLAVSFSDKITGKKRPPMQRRAKLKSMLLRESPSESEESNDEQLVDFSFLKNAKDEPNYNFQRRTSLMSPGFIEFCSDGKEADRIYRKKMLDEEREKRKASSSRKPTAIREITIDLKPYHVEELLEAFRILDAGMELMNIKDVITIIRACGFEPEYGEVKEIMEEVQPINEGYINSDELIKIFRAKLKRKDPIDEVRRAFALFDLSNSGFVTVEDLKNISVLIGENLHEEELKEMIDAADKTGSGKVTLENFVKLIHKKEYFDK